MTVPTGRGPGPGGAVDPAEAVRAVLDDLGPVDHTAGPAPDGADPDHPTDRLERVDEAHRRLRRLLEVPDA